jgi:GH24 family phage-related lysozyme (muramidase)
MIKLKALIKESMWNNDVIKEVLEPPSMQQTNRNFDKSFIEYIKTAENENKYLFVKGKWYPYKDPTGQFYVIAYGHKIPKKKLKNYTKGISDADASRLLIQDLNEAKQKVYMELQSMFGIKIVLDRKREEMLIDFVYNLGTLKDFPKLARAIVDSDWDTVKKEYQRKWQNPSGQTQDLTKRNELFANRFLK